MIHSKQPPIPTLIGHSHNRWRQHLLGRRVRQEWQDHISTHLLTDCPSPVLQPHPPQPQTPSLWHRGADTPAYLSTCVTLDGELVAVGGCDSDWNPTDAVYTYDPRTDSWNVISHMNTARWRCLAAVLPGDRLMVVGGFTTTSWGSECAEVEIATLAVA